MSPFSSLLRTNVVLLTLGLIFSCAVTKQPETERSDVPTVVRIINFMVSQGHETAWAAACRGLSVAAMDYRVDANWLIHRVGDQQYYLVTFGSCSEFQDPDSIIQGFVRHDVTVLKDAFDRLHEVPYEVTSDEVWEQVPAWSTSSNMNSLTHPGVDQRSYRVESGQLSVVDDVLTEMAALLIREHYPYPTEGFRIELEAGVSVHVISFFGSRDDYYAVGRPADFLAARGHGEDWLKLVERLDAVTHEPSRTESRYLHELSYDPWSSEGSARSGG
jgi:hypothetical protein